MKKSLLLAAASLAVISCSKRAMETAENPGVQDPNAVQFATGGTTITSKVTESSDATDAANGVVTFEQGDIIGIYAVYHGKKLSDGNAAFPSTSELQYKKKKYVVSTVADKSATIPYLAAFKPATATDNVNITEDQTIYYLPGGQAYDYYAFFPTTEQEGPEIDKPANTYSFTESGKEWLDQTEMYESTNTSTNDVVWTKAAAAYPGPLLYAYNTGKDIKNQNDGQGDKAPKIGETKEPVHLEFKHAVAKLTLEVEVDKTAGLATDIDKIEMFAGAGMFQGFTFNLKNASEDQATSPVVTANTTLLDGTGSGTTAKFYQFQNRWQPYDSSDPDNMPAKTTSKVTGYLIPSAAVENAKIRFIFSTGNQTFTAKLDKSATGDDSSATGDNMLEKIEAGKEYRFKITIQKSGAEFNGTIEKFDVIDMTDTPVDAE